MSKMKGSSFKWLKNYFKDHFPHVRSVEVKAEKNGPHEYVAKLKVKAGRKWFVVKKKGDHLSEAMAKAKEGMAVKVRREWDKYKVHKAVNLNRF